MPEVKKKGAKRSSKHNRIAATVQAIVILYLEFHPFALQDHLLSACKTNGEYLNEYILPDLLKQKLIHKDEARNKKLYKITNLGEDYAHEIIENIEMNKVTSRLFYAGINLDELRNL